MAKYFLDGLHGKPAPDKTKEPLVLESVRESEFQRAAQAIPGLAARDQGLNNCRWLDPDPDRLTLSVSAAGDEFHHAHTWPRY
ncbi:hypothetical protein VTN96DRAFT_2094 [Rasamsonia emersonii]